MSTTGGKESCIDYAVRKGTSANLHENVQDDMNTEAYRRQKRKHRCEIVQLARYKLFADRSFTHLDANFVGLFVGLLENKVHHLSNLIGSRHGCSWLVECSNIKHKM
jgi:hypothetical protein